jgi:hypothetical protein
VVLASGCGHALWDIQAGKWSKAERKENRHYGHGRVVANGLVAYNPR